MGDHDRKPEPVTKERANQAALKFHQLCCVDWMKKRGGEDNFNNRDAKLIRQFLTDCCKILPTNEQYENFKVLYCTSHLWKENRTDESTS